MPGNSTPALHSTQPNRTELNWPLVDPEKLFGRPAPSGFCNNFVVFWPEEQGTGYWVRGSVFWVVIIII